MNYFYDSGVQPHCLCRHLRHNCGNKDFAVATFCLNLGDM
jgi:hypothetical protein